jgi:hypothetical protein
MLRFPLLCKRRLDERGFDPYNNIHDTYSKCVPHHRRFDRVTLAQDREMALLLEAVLSGHGAQLADAEARTEQGAHDGLPRVKFEGVREPISGLSHAGPANRRCRPLWASYRRREQL